MVKGKGDKHQREKGERGEVEKEVGINENGKIRDPIGIGTKRFHPRSDHIELVEHNKAASVHSEPWFRVHGTYNG